MSNKEKLVKEIIIKLKTLEAARLSKKQQSVNPAASRARK